jgi:hypothetical protein
MDGEPAPEVVRGDEVQEVAAADCGWVEASQYLTAPG